MPSVYTLLTYAGYTLCIYNWCLCTCTYTHVQSNGYTTVRVHCSCGLHMYTIYVQLCIHTKCIHYLCSLLNAFCIHTLYMRTIYMPYTQVPNTCVYIHIHVYTYTLTVYAPVCKHCMKNVHKTTYRYNL